MELVLKVFLEAGDHGLRNLLGEGGTQSGLVKCGGSGSQPPGLHTLWLSSCSPSLLLVTLEKASCEDIQAS